MATKGGLIWRSAYLPKLEWRKMAQNTSNVISHLGFAAVWEWRGIGAGLAREWRGRLGANGHKPGYGLTAINGCAANGSEHHH